MYTRIDRVIRTRRAENELMLSSGARELDTMLGRLTMRALLLLISTRKAIKVRKMAMSIRALDKLLELLLL